MTEPSTPPRISVVITNWNYANYLSAAIDSVLGQTKAAHDLVVVDDGSIDGSRAIIESYGDRIKSVFGENRGQAAAFELGFRVSSGDVFVFLDADDVLKPEAVETIQRVWHPSYAAVCYAMELIDREGRPCGLYPERTDDFDRRPMFVETGSFPFMPTSGNAFARRTVERACPFPAPRWRIGADAFMLRVAALEGRILPLTQVLAGYRVHSGNNYFRVGASRIWMERRGNIDIADLATYFAGWPKLGGDPVRQPAERLRLAHSAVRAHLMLDRDRQQPGRALRSLARRLATTSDAPLGPRLRAAAIAFGLGLGAWRVPSVETWLRYPQLHPDWLRRLLDGPGHRRLRQYLLRGKVPRWRAPISIGEVIDPVRHPEGPSCLGIGWTIPRLAGRAICGGRFASLFLEVAPTPAALNINLTFDFARPGLGSRAEVEVLHGNLALARASLDGETTVNVQLPAGTAPRGATIPLNLRFGSSRSKTKTPGLEPIHGLPPPIHLRSIRVDLDYTARDGGGLIDGKEQNFAQFVPPGSTGWQTLPDGTVALEEATATVAAAANSGVTAVLEIGLPPEQPKGWMRIFSGAAELFSGQWGQAENIWCRLPFVISEESRPTLVVHYLTFTFLADDPLDGRRPVVSSLTLHTDRPNPVLHDAAPSTAPAINPGQVLIFGAGSAGRAALGDTWMMSESEVAVLTSGEGSISVRLPPGITGGEITLAVVPMLPAVPSHVHLVTVMAGDELLARVRLEGEADITVPVSRMQGTIGLRLLSLYAAIDEGTGDFPAESSLQPAAVRLRSLSFSGVLAPRRPRPPEPLFPGRIEALLDGGVDGGEIATALVDVDERSLVSLIAVASSVEALVARGRNATVAVTASSSAPERPAERLRAAIAGMVQGPAWASPWVADLSSLPEQLLWWPKALATWLADDPPTLSNQDAARYEAYLLALLKSVEQTIASEPQGSARHTLAGHVLKLLLPQQLLFRAGSRRHHMELSARVGERILTLEGFQLARSFPRRTRDRLKVGVITRNWGDNPERRIVEATTKSLNASRFVPIVILQSQPEDGDPPDAVNLGGLTLAQSVDLIRSLDLDILILGSFFLRFDALAAIFAHKLAPVQLATAAVSPITTGLSSVDGFLSSELIEPGDAPKDYTEPLILVPGPIQAFAPAAVDEPDPAETKALARRRFGLPVEDILFVSGAMMHKIGDDLLDAWARILAGAPSTRLVLYPFAPNWSVDYAATAFRERACAAVESKGVARDRLIIFDPLSPTDVRRVLRCSDVSLDGFPYTGAATVTEALEQELPVVSLLGDNQRGRQGAGWLRAFGLDDDIAKSAEDYIARATALALDSNLREQRRDLIRARNAAGAPHRDFCALGATLSKTLIAAAVAKGVTLSEQPALPPVQPGPHRYLFHHMPKAGGTSARTVLERWFRVHRDYRDGWSPEMPIRHDLDALNSEDLVCGHFELADARISVRYPRAFADPEWRVFTFVRDPLELSLSGHFFENSKRAEEPGFRPKTLSQRLREDPSDYIRHFGFTPDNWRQVLDRYWFIGTVERLEESLQYIADELGKPMPAIPRLNVTPRSEQPDPADIDAFALRHAFDYEVYNEIRARLDRRLRGG